jgi:hypothetical protein
MIPEEFQKQSYIDHLLIQNEVEIFLELDVLVLHGWTVD